MNFPFKLLGVKCRSGLVYVRTRILKRKLETGVSFLIILGIVWGGYELFYRGALFLQQQGEVGSILLNRIFYLGWSIIFYMLILSNIITSFSTLYRSDEVRFYLTLPLGYVRIFQIKFTENLIYSSWAILLLGFPMTLAYGHVQSLGLFHLSMIMISGLFPMLIIAGGIGMLIVLWVVYFSRWFKIRSIFLFLGVLFTGICALYFQTSQKETILVGDLASFRAMDRYLFNLSQTPFPLIPSDWFTKLFELIIDQNWLKFIYYSTLLMATAQVISTLATLAAERLYYSTVQIMDESRGRKQPGIHRPSRLLSTFKWLPGQTRALMVKEILQFIRTPQQWLQFLIFGFFIAIYLINLSRARVQMDTMSFFWQRLFYILNFGFSGFILAALTARFVFPLMSLEGRGLWLLLTAPMARYRLFQEKFYLTVILFFVLAEIVSVVSNHYLGQSTLINISATVFLLIASVSLTSLSLGLGTVYLQPEESNPMRISSGTGGIITVVTSLFYLTGMVTAMVWILSHIERVYPVVPFWVLILIIVIYNGLFTYLPLRWGYRSLAKREF